ncbi:hypothetical protein [Imbroritus primus]|uniref:hypothetical protein n=1 Tax=Imbroritus primus TaxID=3058603 RepID=UPI003D161A67
MTKERPILFSSAMVRAILEGSKTQTRRLAKPVKHPDLGNVYAPGALVLEREPKYIIERACPYGRPGDRLWVRETFYAYGRWETRYSAKKGRDEWHFVDMTAECCEVYRYAVDGDGLWPMPGRRQLAGAQPGWWKRPSIHMPRAASRILLEVTGVRMQRLQDITEGDAKAEGVSIDERHGIGYCIGADRPPSIRAYRELWEQLNGAGSWNANPWVWVIEFRRIS